MRKSIFIFIFGFLTLFFVFSEEDYNALFKNTETTTDTKNENNTKSSNADFKLSLWGEHTGEFRMPVIPDYFDFIGYIKAPKFLNSFGIELEYKSLKLVSSGTFDIILNDFGDWDKVLNILPLENYISWSPWKIKLSAGLQEFAWGTADGLNPTDNINPRDYTGGLEVFKIPILSASFSMYPVDFFSFDIVYIPFEQNDIFPRDFVEELPDNLFYDLTLDITGTPPNIKVNRLFIPNPKNVNIETLSFEPKNFIVGGKTNFRFNKVDFSFSYLYDFDQYYTPEITLLKTQVGNTPMPPFISIMYLYRPQEIKLYRDRVHRIGTDIKVSVDRFTIWGEFCYTLTTDYLMNDYKKRNHKIAFITGFDFRYGPNDDFYFNFQYFGEVNLNYDDKFYKDYPDGKPDKNKIGDEKYMEEFYYRVLVNGLGGVTEGFLHGISLNMKWPVLNELLTPSITFSYILPLIYDYDEEKRYGSLYIKPELDIMPIDSFHILIGANLYFSWAQKKDEDVKLVTNDKIGTYHKDSSIYIALSYKWGIDFYK